MKKNLVSIIILALLIVNIILTSVMLFSVTGTMKKTASLIDGIAMALSLELGEELSAEAAAEAMKNAMEILEEKLLTGENHEDMPVVIIATVEGDIHDIGKNLVAMMLKNYGFKVIDLGKDVPGSMIIEAARENHADIIALSALMTTTMQKMREVVDLVKQEGLKAQVMIGGAVTTTEYAMEIHADGYAKDAAEAVKVAKRLLGLLNT